MGHVTLLVAVMAICWYAEVKVNAVPVEFLPQDPSGLKIRIPDQGYGMVAIHFSINKPLQGVAPGDINVDINTLTGSAWEYENPSISLHPGDTVNYWLYMLKDGLGQTLLDQSYTVPDTTTTSTSTTTTTTTTTTTRPTTAYKTTDATTTRGEGQEPPMTEVPVTIEPQGATVTSRTTNQDGSQGTCGCSGVAKDSYSKEGSCTSFPCLIFQDEFDKLDTRLWEHELTAGGGGNWEFQYYTNNRSNSYVRDGKLFIKPTLVTDQFGPQFPEHGHLNLWGSQPASECTGNAFYGCERQGMPNQVVNPIQSARLRSAKSFNFRYGRLEVEAKMPTGDWLWPAIWLLPRWNMYGDWPASGEIDLVESRGNLNLKDDKGHSVGVDSMGSTLHFGPFVAANQWPKAHAEYTAPSGTFGDSFHKYRLDWDDTSIRCYVDDKEILNVSPPAGGFWEFGDFEQTGKSQWDNPWAAGDHMAPFDQEFYIIFNVAVGGTAFFPDNLVNQAYPKPWHDKVGHAASDFWHARGQWLPTWHMDKDNGEGAAMQVKYVKVWKMKP